jgi:hypothetical protein
MTSDNVRFHRELLAKSLSPEQWAAYRLRLVMVNVDHPARHLDHAL